MGATYCNSLAIGLSLGGIILPVYQLGVGALSFRQLTLSLGAWLGAALLYGTGFVLLGKLRE